jgi:hypothetical protein
MTLVATSTPEHRHHVKVLFYGQSITEQEWSKQVAEDLRRRFPNADLEIENRAIGGFASQLLIRPAEHDLYPFYPDLLIFHVFGANQQYDQIIHSVRSRTAAEVLMLTDHLTHWPPAVIDEKKDKGMWWDDLMNHRFLPDIAKRYGCGLCDIRGGWLDYLKDNHLEPPALLNKDGAHLNKMGNFVMAHLAEQYLIYRPDLPNGAWKDLTHDYVVGKDAQWKDGKLLLEFDGNRVDVFPAATSSAAAGAKATVLIDGKKPSEFTGEPADEPATSATTAPALKNPMKTSGAYRITRSQPGPWSPVFLSRVDHDTPLALETWTLKLTSVSKDGRQWTFDVAGSVTGPDGSGSSDKPFTSNSGRVRIEPAAWFRGFYPPLPVGYRITWKVLPMYEQTLEFAKIEDAAKDNAVTLIQGVSNGKHTLELIADDPANVPAIASVRAYKPPVKGD